MPKSSQLKEELQELLAESNAICATISGKRIRKMAINRDKVYFDSVESQKKDAGDKGGLVKGSKYHYDRRYNGWE